MKKITIIKIINDDSILDLSIGEIVRSHCYDEDKISLIIVDLLNNDNTNEYIKNNDLKKYIYEIKNEKNILKIYNHFINKIKTKFVNFSTTTTYISSDILSKTVDLLDNQTVMLCPKFHKMDNLKYIIKYFKDINSKYEEVNHLSINDNDDVFNPLLDSYFFKTASFNKIGFSETSEDIGAIDFILRYLNYEKDYIYLKRNISYIIPLENDVANNKRQYYKEWYSDFINYACNYLNTNNNAWVQRSFLYLILVRYASNMNAKSKNVLSTKDFREFEKKVKKCLDLIDYGTINSFSSSIISKTIIQYILSLKSNNNISLKVEDKKIYLSDKDNVISEIEDISIDIMTLDTTKEKIIIDGEIIESIFMQNNAELIININGKKEKIQRNEVYSYTKLFNEIKHQKYTFHIEINQKDLFENNNEIFFEYSYKTLRKRAIIKFKRPLSKINKMWNNSYYSFGDKILTYEEDNRTIYIKKKRKVNVAIKETGLIFEYIFKSKNKKLGIKAVALRMAYWITKPFFRKTIWISFDKLFKGGDNGEYYFKYVNDCANNSSIKMYYVINADSPDFKRLKKEKYKNILKFRSLKHYLCVLNCEIMFATHANPYDYNGYTSGVEKYFRDLLTFNTFCIQHGLSVNQIAKFQNRVYANTKMYFCASKYEIENLSLPEYDYKEYNALKLTGVPRYDGLKRVDKKQILITPTWRQSASSKLVHINSARQYNNDFKESIYYKIYNSLITNEKLITYAKKYGYEIIYLLHPAVGSQISDFDQNGYIKVVASTGNMSYEKILTESSLMITDYSGVQFDFAYMRKPIIYYHPKELPPHYEESSFKYKTMGFGPIIENEKELIDEICSYMKNSCNMQKQYISRVDDFFKYSDHNNCKRIYKESINFSNNQK